MLISNHFRSAPLSILSCSSFSSPRYHISKKPSFRLKPCCSSSLMDHQHTHDHGRSKFMEFPFVSSAHKNLMLDLVSTLEDRLQSQLLPCSLPPDVQYCQNPTATAQASFHIRPATHNSPIDFVLGSWVHSLLPTGGSSDITTLSAYLNSSTDAPYFLFEMIRSSPTRLLFFLDLPPRRDLVLWPDDLKTFYEDTQLDTHRQALEKVQEVQPFFSPSLYFRAVASPTAILVRIQTENGGAERMEEIIRDHLDPISKQVLGIWLDHCACVKREVGEAERAYLKKRDGLIRNKTVEIDLGPYFPMLLGPEVANRVLEAIKEYLIV